MSRQLPAALFKQQFQRNKLMKSWEISSGVNGKLIYLNSVGYLPKRRQPNESRNCRPPNTIRGDPATAADQSFMADDETGARTNLRPPKRVDELIYSFEEAARNKYLASIQRAKAKTPCEWFQNYLEDRILPSFKRIGFDESLTRALFIMAAPAWEMLGPISKSKHWCHPNLIREIEEIRGGILLKEARRRAAREWFAEASHQDLLRAVKDQMDPRNLMGLLDDIATSWIVLPRVYQYLEKHHCRYLPAYLRLVDREKSTECIRIFVGIMIHFTANFTLKFAAETHPKDVLTELLISGYEAMFWKTLRCPPDGLEDIAVFKNFLNWINFFRPRQDAIDGIGKITAAKMEAMQTRIFPSISNQLPQREASLQEGCFLLTLRHGSRGIQTLLKYFDPGPPLTRPPIGMQPHNQIKLQTLQSLFRSIKYGFHAESPRTQQSIREFLVHLKSLFNKRLTLTLPFKNGCRNLLGFVGPRLSGMIQSLYDEIR
jgi:hypothetical protein